NKGKVIRCKKNKNVKKRIFSESSTNILRYFKNVDINNKEKTELHTHCATDKNAQNSLDDKTFRDANSKFYAHGNGEKHADVHNDIYYGENNVHSEEGGNRKRVRSVNYENKMSNEGKVKCEYVHNNAKLNCNYEEYLQTAYLYCKKYFMYRKMEFFSKYLFYRQKSIKNFIFLIEALFLRKKYIDLLYMLQRYKRLWVFFYKGAKTKRAAEKKNNARNKIEMGYISTKGKNSKCGKNCTKLISHKYRKSIFFKVTVQNDPTPPTGEICDVEHSNVCNIENSKVHKLKKKEEKTHTHKMCNTELFCKHKNNYEVNNSTGDVINWGKTCKRKTCNKIYCICYVAFVKIMSLIRMQNQNCLNKCVNFIQKISKKCLLNKNGHYLTHAVIHLYELAGLYNYALKYSMLLFLKYPVYPQIILKLFSFSILSLKDEIYLILLANKVTLYDAYVYIAQNKFSDYFPKIFLYSKLHIIINIKRSFYEQNFSMCYSLSKLLLMDHMYDSSVVTFFVNSAYLLKKIGAIKRLAQELKTNNRRIYFLFCNAALLLHFKQIERSIQIYKYIVDSYQNIFSDLYFYSLFNLIYALQLTQKAHQIVIFCKNLNKLFFNNIHSYILLSYYYFVNDIPTKCYASLRRAHDIYRYHPDTFYLLSLLALQAKRYQEYGAFSELALFFSLRNRNLRNYVFSNIYRKQHKYVPSYLLSYHLEIIDSDRSKTLGILNLSSLLNYVYFEGLIKSYIILHFCSAKRYAERVLE
ncbi:hypothetical protein PCYB_143840, partial [Plasmodium cynomolgi strain B]